MAIIVNLPDLIINKVENREVFAYMKANGLIKDDELYLVDGDGGAILYTTQDLTEEQKKQARLNIGAVTESDLAIAKIDGLQTVLDGKENKGAAESALATAKSYADTEIESALSETKAYTDGEIDALTELLQESFDLKVNVSDIVNNLTTNDSDKPLSAAQGVALKARLDSININLEDLGAGDMLKSVYDIDGNGIVDNSEKLGGQSPSYYAKASDIPNSISDFGITVTKEELNYVDGVTSNIQEQINALITRIAALESKVKTLEAAVGFSTNESDM